MKQTNLFGSEHKPTEEKKYSTKITAPVYEPKNIKPHILELFDNYKTKRLITEINNSDISDVEKIFLIEAAKRHTVFNYEKIADFYAHSNKEMQNLMEKVRLSLSTLRKLFS